MLVECCVDSVEGAGAAEQGGADRVELCSALIEGGLTPSAGTIALARERVRIGLHVMIRPRGGDFLYSTAEIDVMRRDIDAAGELGARGVVFGVLTADGEVDRVMTRELTARARPLSVTFHRAFDMARDPVAALEALAEIGVDRILTSGQVATASEGIDLIARLVQRAGNRLIVMPGGGIDERSIDAIVRQTGAREIHVAAMRLVDSGMRFRNTRCYMGSENGPPEFAVAVTEADTVRNLVARAQAAGSSIQDAAGSGRAPSKSPPTRGGRTS
jgi:copper homeostasis protein